MKPYLALLRRIRVGLLDGARYVSRSQLVVFGS
jgi:hypothetical protein